MWRNHAANRQVSEQSLTAASPTTAGRLAGRSAGRDRDRRGEHLPPLAGWRWYRRRCGPAWCCVIPPSTWTLATSRSTAGPNEGSAGATRGSGFGRVHLASWSAGAGRCGGRVAGVRRRPRGGADGSRPRAGPRSDDTPEWSRVPAALLEEAIQRGRDTVAAAPPFVDGPRWTAHRQLYATRDGRQPVPS